MNNNKITFGWDLCYICNYRCPYCGVWEKASAKDLRLSPQEWEVIWHNLYERYGSIHIFLSGGEPSSYPNFFELVRVLTKEHSVEVCTNLSWDIYRLIPEIEVGVLKVAPTFHPTFANFQDFFEKVIKIKEYLPNHQVYYVAYPGQIREMPKHSKVLREEGIKLIPLPLRGDGFVLNSEEEKRIVEEVSPYRGEKLEYQLQRISPKGKLCRAGQHYAVARATGIVDRCSQYSDGGLGNLLDKDFKLFDGPARCKREYCPIESQWIVKDE
jgi:MoaA/NifB/PqqE/SkfB family radical SAM enzyme